MADRSFRTQPCTAAQAKTRLGHARKFLEVAELVASEEEAESKSVAAALAVLAGIAAADAACCKALGVRSRSDDHRDGATLLEEVSGGKAAAREFGRLVALKDEAHYGFYDVSGANLRGALRRASALIDFAAHVAK